MDAPGFSVRLDTTGDATRVYVTGEIDMATAEHLRASISLALTASQLSELVIDLGEVTFCDSTGLEALVNAQRSCLEREVAFSLHRPSDRLRHIIKFAGLGEHFTIRP